MSLITSYSLQRYHSCAAVLEDIRALKACDWQVLSTHISREVNKCADAMARFGGEGQDPLKFWETNPPLQVLPIL